MKKISKGYIISFILGAISMLLIILIIIDGPKLFNSIKDIKKDKRNNNESNINDDSDDIECDYGLRKAEGLSKFVNNELISVDFPEDTNDGFLIYYN